MNDLQEATPAQRDQLNHLVADAWGPPLTHGQFLERQHFLQALPWTKEREKTWVLTSPDGKILSSCETIELKSYLHEKVGATYEIASVYTEPRLRGNGYAKTMLESLIEKLRSENVHAFTLYSEIGDTLYNRIGFEEIPSWDRVFLPDTTSVDGIEFLSQNHLREVITRITKPSDTFFILPEYGNLTWALGREKIYGEFLKREAPKYCGALVGNSFVVWMADYKYNCLRALLFQSESSDEAKKLIQAGQNLAKQLKLEDFRIWETDGFSDWETLESPGERVLREDALAMILPLASELKASNLMYLPRALWV